MVNYILSRPLYLACLLVEQYDHDQLDCLWRMNNCTNMNDIGIEFIPVHLTVAIQNLSLCSDIYTCTQGDIKMKITNICRVGVNCGSVAYKFLMGKQWKCQCKIFRILSGRNRWRSE